MAELDDLQRLAPTIDREAAGAAFRRRRRRSRSMRRSALAAAAALVMVIGTAAVVANVDDESPLVVGPASGSGPVTFEVLTVAQASDEMGTLRSATSEGEYVNLWKLANASDPRPEVDFDERIVVSITIPDDACPPELTSFERNGDVITPTFVEPGGACEEPLIPKTYVVALDRTPLEPGFTLRLPADDLYDVAEQLLRVELGGEGEVPTVWAQEPSESEEGLQALVVGTVHYDAEHGCFSLGQGELTYPVVWPAGTTGTADGPGVVLPDGEIARVGDEVYGGGGYHQAAEEYDIPAECLPDTGEVAVYNPNEDVTVTPAASGDEASGMVSGTFVAVGGMYGAAKANLSGTITAVDERGETTSTEATDGTFALELSEGTYTFSGVSSQFQDGEAACTAAEPVVVARGEAVSVEVACQRK